MEERKKLIVTDADRGKVVYISKWLYANRVDYCEEESKIITDASSACRSYEDELRGECTLFAKWSIELPAVLIW